MKKRLEQHAGDCSIYAALINSKPESGICICGYGLQCMREGNLDEMYSDELNERLEAKQNEKR